MKHLWENPGFKIHLIVYLAVNALLLVLNLWQDPDHLWFYWPLLGWGFGIAGHAFLVQRVEGRTNSVSARPPGQE